MRIDSTVGRIQVSNEVDQRQSDAVRDRVNELSKVVIANGRLIEDVTLANGSDTVINHKLGRVPKGFFVAKMTGASSAGYILTEASTKDKLTLQANSYGADITVTIWVF